MLAALVALPLLTLLAGGADAPPPEADWRVGVRRVELATDGVPAAVEVRVSSGRVTTLRFDNPVARVEVGERARFQQVGVLDNTVLLVPADGLIPGERLRLTVRFPEDGAAPPGADFVLVAHPVLADTQLEVFRRPRPLVSFREDALEARAEVLRCREETARLRAEMPQPEGIAGLLAAGVMMDRKGISARDASREARQRPGESMRAALAITYRAARLVAVEVKVENPSSVTPWVAAGAALVDAAGRQLAVLPLGPQAPIAPGEAGRNPRCRSNCLIRQERAQQLVVGTERAPAGRWW